MLCPSCEAKVKSGEVTDLDIKVANILLNLEPKYPALEDLYFHKAVEVDDIVVLLVNPQDVSKLLGYGGKIIRAVGEELGKKVRVLAHGVDERTFLEDLFAPATIVAINKIWLPDGSEEMRVVLDHERNLKAGVNSLIQVVGKVKGVKLRVDFERRWRRGGQRIRRGKAAAKNPSIHGHNA